MKTRDNAYELSLSTTLQCWEVHGSAPSIEIARQQSEVVAAAAVSVMQLLQVGCVALAPCGTRVALKVRRRVNISMKKLTKRLLTFTQLLWASSVGEA